MIEKVIAYITRNNQLLVFQQPEFPEAGVQVPAGTVDPGEGLEEAVMREAQEESGLLDLRLQAYLGFKDYRIEHLGLEAAQRRLFFHLSLESQAPDQWRHFEEHRSDGVAEPIAFDFFWVRMPDEVPALAGEQDAYLHRLLEELRG